MNPYLIVFLSSLALNVLLFIWWRCARKDVRVAASRVPEGVGCVECWQKGHKWHTQTQDDMERPGYRVTTNHTHKFCLRCGVENPGYPATRKEEKQ